MRKWDLYGTKLHFGILMECSELNYLNWFCTNPVLPYRNSVFKCIYLSHKFWGSHFLSNFQTPCFDFILWRYRFWNDWRMVLNGKNQSQVVKYFQMLQKMSLWLHWLLTGLVTIQIIASGQYVAAALHRSLTMEALVLNKSSLVIPVKNIHENNV